MELRFFKKTLSLCLIVTVILTVVISMFTIASAATVTITIGTFTAPTPKNGGTVGVINGTISVGGSEVTMLVRKQGDLEANIYAIDQTTAVGSGGAFTFNFSLIPDAPTGVVYDVMIGGTGVETPVTLSFNYGSVTYNANGSIGSISGTVPTDNASYLAGTPVPVAGNTDNLARTGYTFAGWNTAPDGNGQNYTAGMGTFPFAQSTGDFNLYAKWLISPTIATTVNPALLDAATIHVTPRGTETPLDKTIGKSFISYATIANPDECTLVGYGMYLKDSLTGLVIDLPAINTLSEQFAVRVFTSGSGFVIDQWYSLQAYAKYTDGAKTITVCGVEMPFKWQ